MTTQNTGIGIITTATLHVIARAAEGCALDVQPGGMRAAGPGGE